MNNYAYFNNIGYWYVQKETPLIKPQVIITDNSKLEQNHNSKDPFNRATVNLMALNFTARVQPRLPTPPPLRSYTYLPKGKPQAHQRGKFYFQVRALVPLSPAPHPSSILGVGLWTDTSPPPIPVPERTLRPPSAQRKTPGSQSRRHSSLLSVPTQPRRAPLPAPGAHTHPTPPPGHRSALQHAPTPPAGEDPGADFQLNSSPPACSPRECHP